NTQTKNLTQVSNGISVTAAPPIPSESGHYVAVVEQESKAKSVVVFASSGDEVLRVPQGVAVEWIDDHHMVVLVAHKGEYELTLVDIKTKKIKPLDIYSLYPTLYKAGQGRVAYITPSYSSLNAVNVLSFDG